MAEWIEIPAHRIMKVAVDDVKSGGWELYNCEGQTPGYYDTPYLYKRKSDRRVFKTARFVPSDHAAGYFYLEEL